MKPNDPRNITPDSDLVESTVGAFYNQSDKPKNGYKNVIEAYRELTDSLQLMLAVKKDAEKLDSKELAGLVKKVTLIERYAKAQKAAYELTKKAIELQGRSPEQERNERWLARGKRMSQFYRADRPHQLGMLVGGAIDLFDRRRGHKRVDPLEGKNGSASTASLVSAAAAPMAAIGNTVSKVSSILTGTIASKGSAEQGAIERGVAKANKEAAESSPSTGEAVGEQIAGITGMMGDGLGIISGLVNIVSKIWSVVEQASPYMQGMMKLITKAINLFLMPIGNLIATILRPYAIKMITASAEALKKTGSLEGVTSLSDTMVSDILTPMFEELAEIFLKVVWDIIPGLMYGFLVALFQGIINGVQDHFNWPENGLLGIGGSGGGTSSTSFGSAQATNSRYVTSSYQPYQAGQVATAISNSSFGNMISDLFEVIVDIVVAFVQRNVRTFSKLISGIADAIVEYVQNNVEMMNWMFQSIADAIVRFIRSNAGTITQMFKDIVDTIIEFINNNVDTMTALFKGIVEAIVRFVNNNVDTMRELLKGIVDAIIEFINNNVDIMLELIHGIVDAIVTFINGNVDEFNRLIDEIVKAVSRFMNNNNTELYKLFEAIVNAVDFWINGEGKTVIKTAFTIVINTVAKAFVEVLFGLVKNVASKFGIDWVVGSSIDNAKNYASSTIDSLIPVDLSALTNKQTTTSAGFYGSNVKLDQLERRQGYAEGDAHFSPLSPKSIIIGEGAQGESVLTDPQLVGVVNRALSAGLSAANATVNKKTERERSGGTSIVVNFNAPVYGEKELERQVRALFNRINKESGWI